ncbi:MAG: hypothetical protein ACXQTS_01900, partial [Candidatus Methanospirareceae archaeon]
MSYAPPQGMGGRIKAVDIQVPTDTQSILKQILAYTQNPLAANETYEGDWVDVQTKSGIIYLVNTDVDGTLKIQHSLDGTTVDYEDSVSITGGTPASDVIVVKGFYAK